MQVNKSNVLDQEYTLSVGIPETDFGVKRMCCHDGGTFYLLINQIARVCVEGTDAIAGLIVINALVGEWVLRAGLRPIFLRPSAVVERQTHLGKTQRVFLDVAQLVLKLV